MNASTWIVAEHHGIVAEHHDFLDEFSKSKFSVTGKFKTGKKNQFSNESFERFAAISFLIFLTFLRF